MCDDTEFVRRILVNEINSNPSEREILESEHGKVWDTDDLCREFTVDGFLAPFVSVIRKSDGKKGWLEFQHRPRYYYGWKENDNG